MARLSKYGLLIFMLAIMLITACDNSGCIGNSNGIPLVGFYKNNTSVSVNNLTVYGVGVPNDSAIIRQASASKVYMPLRLGTGSCQYVFDYNTEGSPNDTISLQYDEIPYFESHECGAMFNFKITAFSNTTNAIDSVVIPNPMITNDDVVTIKIYMQ